MKLNEALQGHYFQCSNCKSVYRVEAQGEVISGPRCRDCKTPMRRIVVKQFTLRLDERPTRVPGGFDLP
ncbi:hypothetical protein [Alicyclobacillus macrosporangiidus]|uniref:Regulatory protein, FmdB family n=1 Tax=Alicyclobacillus macrosporangiidus TaxID=392015 RepID=A0A1I7L1W2_9BACL|nr:hypothetical protein [Alicyclobacillus macrosporangiidus]SFV03762.1 hypothetical protein SAMN05421543_12332 [Alicyclobacillus macrosporangiidus]